MVELVRDRIQKESIDQYKIEERSIIAKRMISYQNRIDELLDCMENDIISIPKHIDIMEFGKEVANYWGIGTKEKDNGLLITISRYDRKIAINTGLGTEKTILDYECKIIIDSVMVPQFRKTQYYKGVDKALDALFALWD